MSEKTTASRSAAVLGSSNVSTPKTQENYQISPALEAAAPVDAWTGALHFQMPDFGLTRLREAFGFVLELRSIRFIEHRSIESGCQVVLDCEPGGKDY